MVIVQCWTISHFWNWRGWNFVRIEKKHINLRMQSDWRCLNVIGFPVLLTGAWLPQWYGTMRALRWSVWGKGWYRRVFSTRNLENYTSHIVCINWPISAWEQVNFLGCRALVTVAAMQKGHILLLANVATKPWKTLGKNQCRAWNQESCMRRCRIQIFPRYILKLP